MKREAWSIRHRFSGAFPALLGTWGVLALVVIGGFGVAYRYVGAPPPARVRIATGSPDGAYYRFAQQYARVLAEDGVTLDLVTTAGSVENLARLASGDVSLALVQGGVATSDDRAALQSLGSLFAEPVWVFVRAGVSARRIAELKGRRIAVGTDGSGTELLARQILTANGVTEATAVLVRADPAESIEALLTQTVDAVLFVASPEAAFVRRLLLAPGIALMAQDRPEAYARRFSYLMPATLHEGVIDLERNIPGRDMPLVATVANLAAREDLNVSLVPAILNAVTRVHQNEGLLAAGRDFPSIDKTDLPMNADAARYIRNGPTFLYRWLPYRTAVLLDRLKVLALPLVALLLPLSRLGPPLYQWRIRSRIYRWYADLRAIDLQWRAEGSGDRERLLRQLADLEREVASVSVPLAYTGELYHLRLHLRLLQEQLKEPSRSAGAPA